MMNGDRLSSTVKPRRPRVKNSAKLKLDTAQFSPPPLLRSNTAPGKTGTGARTPRSNLSISPEKERVRSDDGFHSDSDKDSNQSAHSVHSNLSAHSSMSRAPSIKSDTIVRVRPKSSLGSMSDLSEKSQLDSLSLAHLAVNRQLQADKQAEEARKNRKIADLEISIRSLTAINAELDATNKRQAAEIIELKRKLRINDTFMSEIDNTDDDDDDLSSSLTELDLAEIAKENDARFRRICHAMDELLRDAQAALDYSTKIVGSKVLTNALMVETNDDTFLDPNEISLDEDHEEYLLTRSPSSGIDLDSESDWSGDDSMTPNESKLKSKAKSKAKSKSKSKSKSKTEVDAITSKSTDPRIKKPSLVKSAINSEKIITSGHSNKEPPPITSGSEVYSIHGDRIREVIQELLVIAKKPSEKKGLGLLLSVQNGHTPHVHNIGEPPSPTVILLYELQELLGYGDAESSKYISENRNSPILSSSRIHFQIDSPDDNDSKLSLKSQFHNAIDNARIIRRRSSPTFRTPPSSPLITHRSTTAERLDVSYASLRTKENVDSNLHPHGANAGKPLSWASSLGFWTPWKV